MSVLEINMSDIKPISLSSSVSDIVCLPNDADCTILVLDHHIFLDQIEESELVQSWEAALPRIEPLRIIA